MDIQLCEKLNAYDQFFDLVKHVSEILEKVKMINGMMEQLNYRIRLKSQEINCPPLSEGLIE